MAFAVSLSAPRLWGAVSVEVAGHGEPVRFTEHESGVGVALGVGEPQVHGGVGGSEDGRAVVAVVVPVVGDEAVVGPGATFVADLLAVGLAGSCDGCGSGEDFECGVVFVA